MNLDNMHFHHTEQTPFEFDNCIVMLLGKLVIVLSFLKQGNVIKRLNGIALILKLLLNLKKRLMLSFG